MITDTITTFTLASLLTITPGLFSSGQVLASHEISLEKRYAVQSVSDIFRDNILLNLAYLDGSVKSKNDINWDEVKKSQTIQFRLNPGETFAYHKDILPEYKDLLIKTTNAHFSSAEGFKADGYLYGDGVCHLASLMYWVARDAGLDAVAPTNPDFMAIPEIYSQGVANGSSARQNLYIKNNKENPVVFKFDYNGENLKLSIVEI